MVPTLNNFRNSTPLRVLAEVALLASLTGISGAAGCKPTRTVPPLAEPYRTSEIMPYYTVDFDLDNSLEFVVMQSNGNAFEIKLWDFDHETKRYFDMATVYESNDKFGVAPFIYNASDEPRRYDYRLGLVQIDEGSITAKEVGMESLYPDGMVWLQKPTKTPVVNGRFTREELSSLPPNYELHGSAGFSWEDWIPGGPREQISLYNDGRLILHRLREDDGEPVTDENYTIDPIRHEPSYNQMQLLARLDTQKTISIAGGYLNDDDYVDLALINKDFTVTVYYNDGHGILSTKTPVSESTQQFDLPNAPFTKYHDLEMCAESIDEMVAKQIFNEEYPGILGMTTDFGLPYRRELGLQDYMVRRLSDIAGIDDSRYMRSRPLDTDFNDNGVNDKLAQILLKNNSRPQRAIVLAEENGSYQLIWEDEAMHTSASGYALRDYIGNDGLEDIAVLDISKQDNTATIQIYRNTGAGFERGLEIVIDKFVDRPINYVIADHATTTFAHNFNPTLEKPCSATGSIVYEPDSDSYASGFFILGIGKDRILLDGQMIPVKPLSEQVR